jgi:hypothetical protein
MGSRHLTYCSKYCLRRCGIYMHRVIFQTCSPLNLNYTLFRIQVYGKYKCTTAAFLIHVRLTSPPHIEIDYSHVCNL